MDNKMERNNAILQLLGYLTEEQWLDAKKQLEPYHHSQLYGMASAVDGRYGTNIVGVLYPKLNELKQKANMKPKKPVLKRIPENERKVASIYFTLSNCALLNLVRNPYNLEQEYHEVNGIVQDETGTSIDAELRSWTKEVNKAKEGDYVYDEWQKVKENYFKSNNN